MRPRPRLRFRAAFRFATCLAVGVIVNVLVAWVCAGRLNPDQINAYPQFNVNERDFRRTDLERLRVNLAPVASDDELLVYDEDSTGAQRRVGLVAPYWHATTGINYGIQFDPSDVPPLIMRTSSGWPAEALEATQSIASLSPSHVSWTRAPEYSREWTLSIRLAHDVLPRVLPLKPLWPGFVINSILYAMAAWLLLFAPFSLRRVLRRRRGLCERCAYPRGPSRVCSECGHPLSIKPGQSEACGEA